MKDLIFIINDGTQDIELVHSPDGWDDTLLEIERSPKFLGIVRTYSVQLKFMKDGAELLRSLFYNKIQHECSLKILKLNRLDMQYYPVFTGIFDFLTFIDNYFSVNITVIDNNLSQLIKKNIDKQFDLSFLTTEIFYRYYNQTTDKECEFIYFSRALSMLMDKVAEGRIVTDEFAIDDTELTTKEQDYPAPVLTNSIGLSGGRFFELSISLSDLLQAIFVLFDLVATVEIVSNKQTLVLKKTVDTFPANVSLDFDKISELKISLATDFLYDTVSVGYPTQEYDDSYDANFRQIEFNAVNKFTNNSGCIVNKDMNLICPIRADVTGIEYYHSFYGNPDLDNRQLFVVDIYYRQNVAKLVMNGGTVRMDDLYGYQGVYNTRIAPRTLLVWHRLFVDSCFFGSSDSVDLDTAPFNTRRLEIYQQSLGVGYDRVGTPYFIPVIIEFTGLLPDDYDFTTINTPETSRAKLSFKGEDYEGFIISMKLKLVGKPKATVKMLCAPSNDLTKLIR